MYAILDQWLSVDNDYSYGMYQSMYFHDDNNHRVTLSANLDDYARLCRLLSIQTIEIMCNEESQSKKSGYTLVAATQIAWDILTTLATDRQGKRGKAYIPTINIRDSNMGKILRVMGKGATEQ